MLANVLDGLPPLYRLALAYSPASTRSEWLTLLAIDARLASIIQQARDPVLAQIRLAWWRERLAQGPAERPAGEPLLQELARWPEAGGGFVSLVDGWEALLGEGPLGVAEFAAFADGRVAAVGLLAEKAGADPSGTDGVARRWALADLACHIGNADERRAVGALHASSGEARRLDQRLRPLLVLERVTTRAMARGGAAALSSPGALFTAMRAGLLGR